MDRGPRGEANMFLQGNGSNGKNMGLTVATGKTKHNRKILFEGGQNIDGGQMKRAEDKEVGIR